MRTLAKLSLYALAFAGLPCLVPGLQVVTAASAQTEATPSPLRPKGLRLFPDTQQGVSGTALPANEFVETQNRLLFIIDFDKAIAGTEIDVAIVNVLSTAGQEQVIFASADKIDKDGRLPVELKLPRTWPVGQYDVRIGVNQRLIASLPFRIRPTAPRNIPVKAATDIGIVTINALSQQTFTPSPRASQRHLYFILDTTGANTGGVTVVWTLTALATSAGNNVVVGSNTTENFPLENTRLAFDVELPRDWPAGKYRVEARINDQLLNALQFDIQP